METRLLSFDRLEQVLGRLDWEEESTNAGGLKGAKTVLRRAMEQELTGRQQECVRLYYFEGLTEKQTGEQLGISKSTVCRHLQKAKRRLGRAVSYAGVARLALPLED